MLSMPDMHGVQVTGVKGEPDRLLLADSVEKVRRDFLDSKLRA